MVRRCIRRQRRRRCKNTIEEACLRLSSSPGGLQQQPACCEPALVLQSALNPAAAAASINESQYLASASAGCVVMVTGRAVDWRRRLNEVLRDNGNMQQYGGKQLISRSN